MFIIVIEVSQTIQVQYLIMKLFLSGKNLYF